MLNLPCFLIPLSSCCACAINNSSCKITIFNSFCKSIACSCEFLLQCTSRVSNLKRPCYFKVMTQVRSWLRDCSMHALLAFGSGLGIARSCENTIPGYVLVWRPSRMKPFCFPKLPRVRVLLFVMSFIREAPSETSRAIASWKMLAILNLECARVHVVLPLLPDLFVGLVRVRGSVSPLLKTEWSFFEGLLSLCIYVTGPCDVE